MYEASPALHAKRVITITGMILRAGSLLTGAEPGPVHSGHLQVSMMIAGWPLRRRVLSPPIKVVECLHAIADADDLVSQMVLC